MEFRLDTAEALAVSDGEIAALLSQVYFAGGYADAEAAKSIFEPSAVRDRGKMLCVREKQSSALAGMVIVVFPGSPARRIAIANETEMHLLGVLPVYRGQGLGRVLVDAAVGEAKQAGYAKMLLATQATMTVAHRLYESSGFVRVPERDFQRGGRDFRAYENVFPMR